MPPKVSIQGSKDSPTFMTSPYFCFLLSPALTCLGSVILETVLFRSPEVATLVLSDLDVPGPGGGGGGGVDVDVDGDTGGTGGHPHVLTSVVATDDWRSSEARHTD